MLVATRPLRFSGGDVAPGEPLPADLPEYKARWLKEQGKAAPAPPKGVLVARRAMNVGGKDIAPGDPLPAGMDLRRRGYLLERGHVEIVPEAEVDIDAIIASAKHEHFGRWLLPNGMRIRSKKNELRDTVLAALT